MARKDNRKFTLAVLSALSVFSNQSLAMNIGDKVNSRGAVQFAWEKDALFFRTFLLLFPFPDYITFSFAILLFPISC